MTCGLEMCFTF